MYKILKVRFKFKGLPNIVLTEDGELWQLPFNSGGNYYGYRKKEMKVHQGQLKYRINRKWYSRDKLNGISYSDDSIIKTNIL